MDVHRDGVVGASRSAAPSSTHGSGSRRGQLRVYLGAAPGVGKTYAMLDEAHRRRSRGADVVIAVVETHDRPLTAALIDGLDVIPRWRVEHGGTVLEELDVDAVLARRPGVALVDELAHTNAPGSRNPKRWQDVEELLAAGIDVVTTLNIQHLESLNDVVMAITGVRQRETVPDAVVRAAETIELVDMSPQSLRRRLAHGNVYPAHKVDAALANWFRVGNLTALRELALLWTADRVDDALARYRIAEGIEQPWPARERVVVAAAGTAQDEVLVRRGARVAQRFSGGELLVLHVIRSDGVGRSRAGQLARQQALTESLGGTWHSVVADDVPRAVLDFAHGVNATQIVVGTSRRSRFVRALSPGPASVVIDGSGDVDVQVVTVHPGARDSSAGRGRRRRGVLGPRRTVGGWVLGGAGLTALTVALHAVPDLDLSTDLLLFQLLGVSVALLGGLWPALTTAVAAGLVANYVFTPPVGTWTIAEPENALAIAVLVVVSAAVSVVVDLEARRTAAARRANATAETLTALAGRVIRSPDTVQALLSHAVTAFGLRRAAVETTDVGSGGTQRWVPVREVTTLTPTPREGAKAAASPARTTVLPVREGLRVVAEGPPLPPSDLRILDVVGQQVDAALERDQLRAEARAGRLERERGATRTALLAAVSHDLRTPLAAIQVGAAGLRSAETAPALALTSADRQALLDDVLQSTATLQRLIDNLLDMSRIDADAVSHRPTPVAVDDLVALALTGIAPDAVHVDVPTDLPLVNVDAGLLERALANLVENALRHGSSPRPVQVTATHLDGHVVLRVIDHGPGLPPGRRDSLFAPFQRGGDAPAGQGVGLGLAVAQGFVEVNGGTLDADDTPGGGLTLTITLPAIPDTTGPLP